MKTIGIILIASLLTSCAKARFVTAAVKDCGTGKTDTVTVKAFGGMCIEWQQGTDSALVDKIGIELRPHTCDFTVLKVERRRK